MTTRQAKDEVALLRETAFELHQDKKLAMAAWVASLADWKEQHGTGEQQGGKD